MLDLRNDLGKETGRRWRHFHLAWPIHAPSRLNSDEDRGWSDPGRMSTYYSQMRRKSPSKRFLHSGIGPSFLRTARHITAEICLSLLVGHAKGTIPDCLIRGLGDLTGWSIAKPIRVVLPYLHVSWQMTSVPLREAVRYSGSVRAASASPLIRLIHDTRIHDTRIQVRSFSSRRLPR